MCSDTSSLLSEYIMLSQSSGRLYPFGERYEALVMLDEHGSYFFLEMSSYSSFK